MIPYIFPDLHHHVRIREVLRIVVKGETLDILRHLVRAFLQEVLGVSGCSATSLSGESVSKCIDVIEKGYSLKKWQDALDVFTSMHQDPDIPRIFILAFSLWISRKLLATHNLQSHEFESDDFQPICWASKFGHTSLVNLLLEHKADVEALNGFPLYAAAQHGHVDTTLSLLHHGASPIRRQGRALYWATYEGHQEIVKLLIEAKSPCDNKSFVVACETGNLPLVKLFIEAKADPFQHRNAPFITACRFGQIQIVDFLIDLKADVNAHDGYPLYEAVYSQNTHLVKRLVALGADCPVRLLDGVINMARGRQELVDCMIEHRKQRHGWLSALKLKFLLWL